MQLLKLKFSVNRLFELYLVETINSLASTSNTFAISTNVSREGCTSLVHHLDTVAVFLSNFPANHLLVLPCSAKTTLSRLITFLATFFAFRLNQFVN